MRGWILAYAHRMLRGLRETWTYWRLMMRLARQLGKGEPAPILETGERVLVTRPRDFIVLITMARSHATLGDADSARQFYLRALEEEPDHFDVLREAGQSFFDGGDNERAYPLIKRALANAPELGKPPDPLDTRVTRVIGWLKGRRDAAAARRRQHLAHDEHVSDWLDWAAEYVEWCESVLNPGSETVN